LDVNGDHINILANVVGSDGRAGWIRETTPPSFHEQMIVFERCRSVRRERILRTGADHAAHAGLIAGRAGERATHQC